MLSQYLCRAKTAILADQAAEHLSALDLGEIDCSAGPTMRGFLLEGLVRAVAVIAPGVLGQDLPEMPLTENQHVIQALVAQRAYEPAPLSLAAGGCGPAGRSKPRSGAR